VGVQRGKDSALGYVGQPRDVANLVSFLVSEKSSYITGQSEWEQFRKNKWRRVLIGFLEFC
jgi:hypothetical protein